MNRRYAASIGLARDLRGLPGGARLSNFNLDAPRSQPLQRGTSIFAPRPPPAAGFTIARKDSLTPIRLTRFVDRWRSRLESHNRFSFHALANVFGQFLPLDLHGSGAGKILVPHQICAHAFEIRQPPVAGAISSSNVLSNR